MTYEIVKMRAADLVEDLELHPRNSVYDGHVYDLAEAIRAGAALPPVVADERTKRISDGVHRRRSWLVVGGDDVVIDVMLVNYPTDADLIRDAIRRNVVHGRRLTAADLARCAVLAEKYEIRREELVQDLAVTRERLDAVTASRFAVGSKGQRVVLRRGMSHLAGQDLTAAQTAAVPQIGGQTAMYHANQLIALLEAGALPEDDRLLERLALLRTLLLAKVRTGMVGAVAK